VLAAISGLLQLLPFPMAGPAPGWRTAFCWIALVPLLAALGGKDSRQRRLSAGQGAWLGYLCGFVWYLGNCYWIYRTMNLYGGLPPAVSLGILILFALYLGLYHALFGGIVAVVCRGRLGVRGALWLAPFAWVAVELARARITGFPWDLLGNSQVDNLLLTRLAPVGGAMSLSFVIVAVNCLIASGFALRSGNRLRARRSGNRARLWIGGLACATALQLGGTLAARHVAAAQPQEIAVLLQENLEVGAMGREAAPLSTEQMYAAFIGLSERPQPLVSAKPEVIVWPEAPAGFFSSDPRFRQVVGGLAQATGATVIAGSLGVDRDTGAVRGYKLFDSAALFRPDGSFAGRYDKIHLVPWGEYVPFKDLFFFAGKLTAGVGNMDPGTERSVFRSGGHAYGVFVCYESIFGDEVREFVKNGAEVLVNISDDGWYGDTGAPWQHLNMARMRAIENHRWIIRDTNTGITTTIDPRGRIWAQAPRHIRGAYAMRFEYESVMTLYTRFGDWFAWGCVLITILALAWNAKRPIPHEGPAAGPVVPVRR
jgi:apolipoprotein N-acyltransferase